MEIKIHYNNNVDKNEKKPDYKEFDELIKHVDDCSLRINKFYKDTFKRCKTLSVNFNKAYNDKDKNVLTDEDFRELKELLLITGERTSKYFNNGVISDELLDAAEKDFDYDFNCLKAQILGLYNSYRIKLDTPSINELMKQMYRCKTIDELIVVTKSYYNDNLYYKGVISSVIGLFGDVLNDTYNSLNEFVKTSLEQRRIIKKIDKMVNNKRPIDYSLIEDLQLWFLGYNIDFEKTLTKEVINKYNDDVSPVEEKVIPSTSVASQKPSFMYYETREERLAKYNIKNKKYGDSGEQDLSKEELECLNVYFDVIENLNETELENFENRTSDYLVTLLDDEAYPVRLIECLIKKINSSDSIDISYKKKITKAVSHLA